MPYIYADDGMDGLNDDLAKAEDAVATALKLIEPFSPKDKDKDKDD